MKDIRINCDCERKSRPVREYTAQYIVENCVQMYAEVQMSAIPDGTTWL